MDLKKVILILLQLLLLGIHSFGLCSDHMEKKNGSRSVGPANSWKSRLFGGKKPHTYLLCLKHLLLGTSKEETEQGELLSDPAQAQMVLYL